MSRTENEVPVTPSVLDRLLDYQPRVQHEDRASRAETLRQYKQAVRRDLEWLLNTRRMFEHLPPEMSELGRSLAVYGLPDFSSAKIDLAAKVLRRELEAAVSVFEPRLRGVAVSFAEVSDVERVMVFRVEARLHLGSASEHVAFGAALDLDTGGFKIRES